MPSGEAHPLVPYLPEGQIVHPASEYEAFKNVDGIFCRFARELDTVDGRNRILPDIRTVISLCFSETLVAAYVIFSLARENKKEKAPM